MSVYVEHVKPLSPSGIRRYDDLAAACERISRDSHVAIESVTTDLQTEFGFRLPGHSWRIVTAEEMMERAAWANAVADRIVHDEDVDDLSD